jgi:hypothetical protein
MTQLNPFWPFDYRESRAEDSRAIICHFALGVKSMLTISSNRSNATTSEKDDVDGAQCDEN